MAEPLSPRSPADADHSISTEQLKLLQTKLGAKASLLASAYAELYTGDIGGWKRTATRGACALIIDRSRDTKPKLLQIYDLKTFDVSFEVELLEGMAYQMSKPTFHQVDPKNGKTFSLQFFDTVLGKQFGEKVISMMPHSQHGEEKKAGIFKRIFSFGKHGPTDSKPMVVGTPTNFVHQYHIGFDPAKGFDTSNIPPEWKELFKQAGVKKKDLTNPETAQLIYETATAEMQSMKGVPLAPPVPSNVPAPPPIPTDEEEEPTGRAMRSQTVSVTSQPSQVKTISPSSSDDSVIGAKGTSPANTDLNAAIQSGLKNLKKVMDIRADEPDMMDLKSIDHSKRNSMISTLRNALQRRRMVIAQEDIEEETEEDAEDSDWE